MRRISSRALVGALSASLLLAACGDSQPFPGGSASGSRIEVGAPVVLSALKTTNSERSARMAMRMEMSGIPGADSFVATGGGAMTTDGNKIDFTMKVGADGKTITMSIRGIGNVVYVRMSGVPNAPDKWMKLSMGDLGGAGASFGSASDPSQYLDYLYGIADKIEQVGHEKIRGVDTTHYYAVIDLQRAVDNKAVPAPVRQRLRNELASAGIVIPPMPTDIWIDDAGRLRKMQLDMDFGGLFGSVGGLDDSSGIATTITLELYDFGVAVDVQPPPADQIMPLNRGLLGAGTTA